MSDQGSLLELRDEGGDVRHYLAGRPVHCGEALELLTDGGWLPVRYEGRWRRGGGTRFAWEPPPAPTIEVTLYLPRPVGAFDAPALTPQADARLRWPSR